MCTAPPLAVWQSTGNSLPVECGSMSYSMCSAVVQLCIGVSTWAVYDVSYASSMQGLQQRLQPELYSPNASLLLCIHGLPSSSTCTCMSALSTILPPITANRYTTRACSSAC